MMCRGGWWDWLGVETVEKVGKIWGISWGYHKELMEISWGHDVNVIWVWWSMDWSWDRLGFCHHWVQHRLNDRFHNLIGEPRVVLTWSHHFLASQSGTDDGWNKWYNQFMMHHPQSVPSGHFNLPLKIAMFFLMISRSLPSDSWWFVHHKAVEFPQIRNPGVGGSWWQTSHQDHQGVAFWLFNRIDVGGKWSIDVGYCDVPLFFQMNHRILQWFPDHFPLIFQINHPKSSKLGGFFPTFGQVPRWERVFFAGPGVARGRAAPRRGAAQDFEAQGSLQAGLEKWGVPGDFCGDFDRILQGFYGDCDRDFDRRVDFIGILIGILIGF